LIAILDTGHHLLPKSREYALINYCIAVIMLITLARIGMSVNKRTARVANIY
jgi:Flp pilus assembly pilin Flp